MCKDMKRAERRLKNQKKVDYRKHIIKDIWHSPEQRFYVQEGRLRKHNFTCDCSSCQWKRWEKKPKAKYRWYYHNRDMGE